MIARKRLTEQEMETAVRLSAQGRTTGEIAATLARSPATIGDFLKRHGLRRPAPKPAPQPAVRYEVTIRDIPPPVFRLLTDCAVRRKITTAEAMLRFTQHCLKYDSPSKALDTIQWGATR
jgi:hypothetical protein